MATLKPLKSNYLRDISRHNRINCQILSTKNQNNKAKWMPSDRSLTLSHGDQKESNTPKISSF